jgi:hypothetical protein
MAVLSLIAWRRCCAQAPANTAPPPPQAPQPTAPIMPQQQQHPAVPQLALPAPTPSAPTYAPPQQLTFDFQKPTTPVLIYT